MLVTIRLFARLRELAGAVGARAASCPTARPRATAWDVARRATSRGARRVTSRSISCAVNEEYARLTTPLNDGDEVAFLPPVSGG